MNALQVATLLGHVLLNFYQVCAVHRHAEVAEVCFLIDSTYQPQNTTIFPIEKSLCM